MDDFRVERDDVSAPFFDAARDGRLVVRHCATCGRLFPPNYLHESWMDFLYWDSELEE